MKTTFNLSEEVMVRLKQEAARRRTTMSELVEVALRQLLDRGEAQSGELPPLPAFDSGGAWVDVSDRDALYQAMEGR